MTPKLCTYHCVPLCDFCRHFDYNGDADGTYTGEGWCRLHKRKTDPDDDCDDFHCRNAELEAVDRPNE